MTSEYVAAGTVPRGVERLVRRREDGFAGAIHEVALWDEAVEVTNLLAQMYETKMPTTEHLIGYWKFNEGSGSTIVDRTGNGNNAIAKYPIKWVEMTLPEE